MGTQNKGSGEDLVLMRDVLFSLRERVRRSTVVNFTSIGVVLSIDGVETTAEERQIRIDVGYTVSGNRIC